MRFRICLVVLLALSPALASAKPRTVTAHMRPQLFRDRTPKARTHDASVHQVHVTPTPIKLQTSTTPR